MARPLDSAEDVPYEKINIKSLNFNKLSTYELKDTKASIPKLREAFEILKVRPAPFVFNVEIKDSSADIVHAVLDLAKEMGILE